MWTDRKHMKKLLKLMLGDARAGKTQAVEGHRESIRNMKKKLLKLDA